MLVISNHPTWDEPFISGTLLKKNIAEDMANHLLVSQQVNIYILNTLLKILYLYIFPTLSERILIFFSRVPLARVPVLHVPHLLHILFLTISLSNVCFFFLMFRPVLSLGYLLDLMSMVK